jgi:signal transduction histidine kinase
VHVTVGRHDQWAVIAVRDRGVGIPHEELPHIFTPFYRASTARGIPGTGIGLSGSKLIVEQHGGQITAESAVGKGTTVVVRLPGPCE